MEILVAILYGVIQGLTEFLPISSSAHLAIIPHYLKIADPGVYFDLMMHLGTVFALLVYFRKKIWTLGRIPLKTVFGLWKLPEDQEQRGNLFLYRNLLFSTFASIIAIVVLKKLAELYGRNYYLISANLVIFGILLYVADRWPIPSMLKLGPKMERSFNFKASLLIGIAQALAIFPGISRSGITITTARWLGFSRLDASTYTFFLSIPIILLAASFKIAETLTVIFFPDTIPVVPANNLGDLTTLVALAIGLITSTVTGILTIHYFLKLVNNIPFAIFTIYRVILALLLLNSI
ncbi:MAG: undecaprenyl-diphosphate phosphatase [Oligoflexia bacterium]|nr:undecaprenyl-diphosphate phosphatase [Oligoflexia bacterium]